MMARALARAASARRLISAALSNSPTIRRCSSRGGRGTDTFSRYDLGTRCWPAVPLKFALKPHRVKTFKLSNDPKFAAKVQDVVGLYVDPPEHAVVLSVDEKSQIQALDRTQPGLPMKKGRCGTMTHDYKSNGTTTLFAALDVLDGKVIGQCMARHRHQEFIRFLNKINRETPAGRSCT